MKEINEEFWELNEKYIELLFKYKRALECSIDLNKKLEIADLKIIELERKINDEI